MTTATPYRPQSVGIVGDSLAGLLAALTLKEWRPALTVTLCGPRRPLPPGESHTAPAFVAFLHGYLGLDLHRFHSQVRPGWRLGTAAAGVSGGTVTWPYQRCDLGDAWTYDGHLGRASMAAQLMAAAKMPIVAINGQCHSLLAQTPFGYTFAEDRLRAFLETRAGQVRIQRVPSPLATVVANDRGVDSIVFEDGARLATDLWLDATGDGALLLGESLGVPRVAGPALPARSGSSDSATTSIQTGRTHRRAVATLHNVMAIGTSYCWLGPDGPGELTLTAQHLTWLLGLMTSSQPSPEWVNTEFSAHWEAELALALALRDAASSGRPADADHRFVTRDSGFLGVARGQTQAPAPTVSAADWRELVAMRQQVVNAAMSPEDALDAVVGDRRLLDALTQREDSWLVPLADRLNKAAPPQGRSPRAIREWAVMEDIAVTLVASIDASASFEVNPSLDFGKFVQRAPDFVLRPKDQAALSRCLVMLGRRQIPFKTRGSGHTSGGQTLADHGAIIDLRGLRRIVHDAPERDQVTIEAGAWWLELATHLHRQGRCLATATMNWRVTVGGTLAVGGFGDRSHNDGLQTRTVLGLRVMTLDGESHGVGPGDPLFDYALAGRGQVAIITEVTVATARRSDTLMARVLTWRTVNAYLRALDPILRERRFALVRTRLEWETGIVRGALGNFQDTTRHQDTLLTGLHAKATPLEPFQYFAEHTKPPNDHWLPDCPAVEMVLPYELTAPDAGAAMVERVRQVVLDMGLGPYLPLGSSIMVVPTAGHTPLVPLPSTSHALLLAVRPAIPNGEGTRWAKVMRQLATLTYTLGGKLYLVGIEQPGVVDLEAQFGAALPTWRALKRTHDPLGLMNPGLLNPGADRND